MYRNMSEIDSLLQAPAEEQSRLGYAYTAREIAGQPELWLKTLALMEAAFPDLADFLGKNPVLLLSGAGSSHYVGVSVQPALKRVFSRVDAIPSTEILMDPESSFPREPFVLVSFARSGNSPEGNAVSVLAEQLRPGQVRQIAITCNREGRLASLVSARGSSGRVILLPEQSNDRSLAMTSSFSCMVIAGLALAYLDRQKTWSEQVRTLAASAETFLPIAADCTAALSREHCKRVFFIASRPFLGGALESQLKVQELSGGAIIAKAEDTLGLRHGFMAAIDRDSLIIFFRSGDATRRLYENDLIDEISTKKLGRQTVIVSDTGQESAPAVQALPCGTVPHDDFRSVLVTLFGQLLGLFISLECGLKPDNPSPEGVINRVVQGVTIYLPQDTAGVGSQP